MTATGNGQDDGKPESMNRRVILDRFTGVCRDDVRILAAWLIGSIARGTSDGYSDIDLLMVVSHTEFDAVISEWHHLAAQVSPTIFHRRIGSASKPTITAITPDWTRFDITIASSADSQPHGYDAAVLLFARGTLANDAQLDATPDNRPNHEFSQLVEDFLRVLGLLPVAIGREEYVLGMTGAMLLQGYLIDLMLLETNAQRGGVKRLRPLLTMQQYAQLESLPPLQPTRAAVISKHVSSAELFLSRARAYAEILQLQYPITFERATFDHLYKELGIIFS